MSLIRALLCEVLPTDEAAGVLVKKGLCPPPGFSMAVQPTGISLGEGLLPGRVLLETVAPETSHLSVFTRPFGLLCSSLPSIPRLTTSVGSILPLTPNKDSKVIGESGCRHLGGITRNLVARWMLVIMDKLK